MAMLDQLINRWWIIAARGTVAVVFGVAAFLAPHATMAYLVSLFGLFALADGIFTIGAGLALSWLALFMEGIVGGSIGLFTILFPVAGAMWLLYFIVAWAFVTGALELSAAYGLWRAATRPLAEGEWLLGLSGAASLLFGGVAAVQSTTDVTRFMWTVGAYALISGALLVVLAFNIRTWPRTV
jgi:uncharacterized membrane protein HdeD (DUF308 family)